MNTEDAKILDEFVHERFKNRGISNVEIITYDQLVECRKRDSRYDLENPIIVDLKKPMFYGNQSLIPAWVDDAIDTIEKEILKHFTGSRLIVSVEILQDNRNYAGSAFQRVACLHINPVPGEKPPRPIGFRKERA